MGTVVRRPTHPPLYYLVRERRLFQRLSDTHYLTSPHHSTTQSLRIRFPPPFATPAPRYTVVLSTADATHQPSARRCHTQGETNGYHGIIPDGRRWSAPAVLAPPPRRVETVVTNRNNDRRHHVGASLGRAARGRSGGGRWGELVNGSGGGGGASAGGRGRRGGVPAGGG